MAKNEKTYLLNEKRWPTPGSVPFLEALESIKSPSNMNNIQRFIECGSGESGDNAVAFSNFFEVITIENNKSLYDNYKDREDGFNKIEFVLGDGRDELKNILSKNPDEQFVILLDDHNGYISFIKEEMEIIKEHSSRNDHVIIIDDMNYAGMGSYPTVEQLNSLAKNINQDYTVLNTKIGADIYIVYKENT